jgi:hypothetical protein
MIVFGILHEWTSPNQLSLLKTKHFLQLVTGEETGESESKHEKNLACIAGLKICREDISQGM